MKQFGLDSVSSVSPSWWLEVFCYQERRQTPLTLPSFMAELRFEQHIFFQTKCDLYLNSKHVTTNNSFIWSILLNNFLFFSPSDNQLCSGPCSEPGPRSRIPDGSQSGRQGADWVPGLESSCCNRHHWGTDSLRWPRRSTTTADAGGKLSHMQHQLR